jgi:hypothetical protein
MVHDDKRRAVLLRQLNQFLFFHGLSVSVNRDPGARGWCRSGEFTSPSGGVKPPLRQTESVPRAALDFKCHRLP